MPAADDAFVAELLSYAEPFALWELVPAELRGVLLNITWDPETLFDLQLPVEKVPVDQLRWQLGLRWWRFESDRFAISPNDVRADPNRYDLHWRRTLDADLSYPIHVVERECGLAILDGVHRLLKAEVAGASHVAARRLSLDDLRCIAKCRRRPDQP